MELKNVYPQFGVIKIDDILDEVKDIEFLTPKQLLMLFRNCERYMNGFDNMTEKRYAIIGDKEYTKMEHKYRDVNELKDFIEDNWCECLI